MQPQANIIPSSGIGAPRIRSTMILHLVADHFGLTVEQILKGGRTQYVALARHMAFYLFRTTLKLSLPQIGLRFNRDHATVLYGYRRIARLIQSDPEMASVIALMEAELRGARA